jgi:hypothetical protein
MSDWAVEANNMQIAAEAAMRRILFMGISFYCFVEKTA